MPENASINKKFGVYQSLCCDAEIVIGEGLAFPDCPKHPNLPTNWKPVTEEHERFPHVRELFPNKRNVA